MILQINKTTSNTQETVTALLDLIGELSKYTLDQTVGGYDIEVNIKPIKPC